MRSLNINNKCIFPGQCDKIPICVTCTRWEFEMERLSIALVLLFFTISAWAIFQWWQGKKRYWKYLDKIPGPFALPLVGNLVQLSSDHAGKLRKIMLRYFFTHNDILCIRWIIPTQCLTILCEYLFNKWKNR